MCGVMVVVEGGLVWVGLGVRRGEKGEGRGGRGERGESGGGNGGEGRG